MVIWSSVLDTLAIAQPERDAGFIQAVQATVAYPTITGRRKAWHHLSPTTLHDQAALLYRISPWSSCTIVAHNGSQHGIAQWYGKKAVGCGPTTMESTSCIPDRVYRSCSFSSRKLRQTLILRWM